jgi:hypothetical protein
MLATQTKDKVKTGAGVRSQRDGATPSAKDAMDVNPVWQSLALRTIGTQPKLTVSQPSDPYEQEADQIADRVMRMAAPQSTGSQPSFSAWTLPQIQRKCDHCEEEEEKLQRKEQAGNSDSPATASTIVHEALNSPGQPLDPLTRSYMEPRFGHDFSRVRLHTGTPAAQSAQALSARAFTVGHDIVFGKHQYVPDSAPGRLLLAHELTHVVQQGERKDAAASTLIQRDITSISIYEARDVGGSPRQVQTTRTMRGVAMPVSYDAAASVFTVTFRLAWIFPHAWSNTQRNAYVQSFEASVRRVWDGRFSLNETRAPRRTAHVRIAFDHFVIPQMANQTLEEVQLSEPAAWGRWRMDVRTLNVQENVDRNRGAVQLGATSMDQTRRKPAELRRGSSFSYSGTGGNRTYSQAAAPHEFGHMMGLGDEYLVDAGEPIPSAVRGQINSRIMNVGEEVTPDAYAPFAAWLSELTSSTWRVGHRVP